MERLASTDQRLVVLAPGAASVPRFFRNVPAATAFYDDLLDELQRLRGSVYLEDGAVSADQLIDGRHCTPEDERAWHLLILHRDRISACVWYLDHRNAKSLDQLRVRDCPLTRIPGAAEMMRSAIQGELGLARREQLHYAEIGGWAVAPQYRHTGDGLLLALAAYSLGRAFGGALGLTTATVRHASSSILRRLGGASLEVDGRSVPAYFDRRYGCDMELLRFDSRHPNPRYGPIIELLKDQLATVPVIARAPAGQPTAEPRVSQFQWRPVAATGGAAA